MKTCDIERLLRTFSCAALLLTTAANVHAQSQDQASARALFDEGRRLAKAGQYAAACPKFEAAQKVYPSAGILLNLADCYEKVGRTASAWSEFGEAASVASRSNRSEDADEARRRQAVLEPTLTRLLIRVPHAAPGLSIKRDGASLSPAAWGAMLPVDPGTHEVHAEAPGFEPWTFSVALSKPGQTTTVDVPELQASALAAPAAAETVQPANSTAALLMAAPPSHTVPWILVGGGAALAIAGGALMLIESGRASNARANHDPAAYDGAQTPWTLGLVGAIAGGVGAGAGVVLLTTSRGHASAAGTRLSPWMNASGGGIRLGGTW